MPDDLDLERTFKNPEGGEFDRLNQTLPFEEINPDQFKVGALFANRYKILLEGKRGGMGTVYKVRDDKLKIIKALKVINPRFLHSKQALQRFRQEVSISLQLSHKNIVRVYDLDEYQEMEFFTMEWMEGKSLREVLTERKKENRPFVLKEALSIISQLADALSHAHRITIHRDIKPENILLSEDESGIKVKLTDFGIAKLLTPSQFMSTSLHMGSPHYMAPEQKSDSASVDKRADIYATGVVLFEMLTLNNTIGLEMPSEINKELPKEIDDIIKKALTAKPENRYGDIKELSEALNAVIRIEREVVDNEGSGIQEFEDRRKKEKRLEIENQRIAEETSRAEKITKKEEEEKKKAEDRSRKKNGKLFNRKIIGGIVTALLIIVLFVYFKGKPKEEAPLTPPTAEKKVPEPSPASAPPSSLEKKTSVPQLQGYVNDYAKIISPVVKAQLEEVLKGLEETDTTQMVILTIPSLQAEAIESFALKVGNTWKIGQKNKDNGIILVVAKQERKIRVEIGRGLKGRVSNLIAGRIIDQEITPKFKKGDFDGGFSAGVSALIKASRGEFKAN
jgi:serine/threonine protein kinase